MCSGFPLVELGLKVDRSVGNVHALCYDAVWTLLIAPPYEC